MTIGLLAVAPRYGFHRDELYFLMAGRRLDWGFADQPPLTPLIASIVDSLPGDPTPLGLRVLPAFSAGAVALISAQLAIRFGGTGSAAVLAAAGAGGAGFFLASGHLLSTTTVEFLLASLIVAVIAALLDGAPPRWWLAVGLLTGLGLLNKYTLGGIVGALLIGVATTRARRLLRSPWPWAGMGLAALIWLPNLLWQAGHGWPQREMAAALRDRSEGPVAFVAYQLVGLSVVLAIPAVAGLVRLWRMADGRWRAFPVAFTVMFTAVLFSGGKFYYVAPLYVPLLAGGACWAAELATLPRRLLVGTSTVALVGFSLLALPVVPLSSLGAVNEVNGELGETVGWPELVGHVEDVVARLDTEQRRGAVILTANYGQAAALEVLGGPGLPTVASGHNAYGEWGPPADHGSIIGVGSVAGALAPLCPTLEFAGQVDNGVDVTNQEQGAPILLCSRPIAGLATIWDDVRHLD